MSTDIKSYLDKNHLYWENANYDAVNVGHPAFKFYGLILKPELNISGENGEKLLDWGCGRGANVNYFNSLGFKAFGVDVSKNDIEVAKIRYPHISNRFSLVLPDPDEVKLPIDNYEVITAIQSLYYLSDEDFSKLITRLYMALNKKGIIYATMVGTPHYYYKNSSEHQDGLRKVTLKTKRGFNLDEYYLNFTKDKEHLKSKFSMFTPLHIGYYDEQYREDEGSGFHWTFVGIKD